MCVGLCTEPWTEATEVSGGRFSGLRTAFMSVLDPVVGLSTEVQQWDNDM